MRSGIFCKRNLRRFAIASHALASILACSSLVACSDDEESPSGGSSSKGGSTSAGGSAGVAGSAGAAGATGVGGSSGASGSAGGGGSTGSGGAAGVAGAAGDGGSAGDGTLHLTWDFEDGGYQGFSVGMSDFEDATQGVIDHSVDDLPAPLSGKGIRVFADNRSDDLWHFIARSFGAAEGVASGQTYQVTIRARVASNAPSGCVGVGGPPDGVTIKSGVVAAEPEPVRDQTGYIGFSADKGNQSQIGSEAVDLGTIGTSGENCTGSNPWELLDRSGTMSVTSANDGTLWVYVGGDSGFETDSTLYYDQLELTLTPQ
jgi:hypothetical protein